MPKSLDPASDAHWRDLLRGFAASGLSVREFCARHGLPPSRFYSRRRALAAAAALPGPPPGVPLFVPLRMAGPGAGRRRVRPAAPPPHPPRGGTSRGADRAALGRRRDHPPVRAGAGRAAGVGPGGAGREGRRLVLSVSPATRVLLCTLPTDMRRSFDTLAGMVRQHLGGDPLSGTLFVFRSRGGDRVKVLYWDRDGYALWYKRLEKGTFRFPEPASPARRPGGTGAAAVEVSASELLMLLEGVDLKSVKRSERFVLKPS